jgi:hypothetical protein
MSEVKEKYENLLKAIILGFFKLIRFENNIFIDLNQKKRKNIKDKEEYRSTEEYRDNLKPFFQDFSNFFTFEYFSISYYYLNLPRRSNRLR